MKRILAAAAVLSFPLHAAEPPPPAHAHPGPALAGKQPAPPASPRNPTARAERSYRSAFTDYRPFDADAPAKDWREANEEVRAAGGHAGLMSHGKAKEGGR